jgi:hypothetical protein
MAGHFTFAPGPATVRDAPLGEPCDAVLKAAPTRLVSTRRPRCQLVRGPSGAVKCACRYVGVASVV